METNRMLKTSLNFSEGMRWRRDRGPKRRAKVFAADQGWDEFFRDAGAAAARAGASAAVTDQPTDSIRERRGPETPTDERSPEA